MSDLRQELIEKLGAVCQRCGIDDMDVLQVAHIHDSGPLDRERFLSLSYMYVHYFNDLTEAKKYVYVLCANCNWKQRSENRDIVGHESALMFKPLYIERDQFGNLVWKDKSKGHPAKLNCPQCNKQRWQLIAGHETHQWFLRCSKCGLDAKVAVDTAARVTVKIPIRGIKPLVEWTVLEAVH